MLQGYITGHRLEDIPGQLDSVTYYILSLSLLLAKKHRRQHQKEEDHANVQTWKVGSEARSLKPKTGMNYCLDERLLTLSDAEPTQLRYAQSIAAHNTKAGGKLAEVEGQAGNSEKGHHLEAALEVSRLVVVCVCV